MSLIDISQIEISFTKYLSNEESILTIGTFKKVPSISHLLLTRGMAWFLSRCFYVAVTNQRLIILPNRREDEVLYANYDEVNFSTDPINNLVLNISKTYRGMPLNLRFKFRYQFKGMDQFDFIAAVKQRKGMQVTQHQA